MNLSEKILKLRTARGMSQGDLAEKLEVSRQSVSKWETGLSRPGLETLEQIARTLEVEPERLFYGEEEGKKPRYRRVSFWPVLGVVPGWYFGIILLGMTLGRFLGDGDAGILILGQLMLGMLIVFCTRLILDEIRNRDYYEKAEAEEEEKK